MNNDQNPQEFYGETDSQEILRRIEAENVETKHNIWSPDWNQE